MIITIGSSQWDELTTMANVRDAVLYIYMGYIKLKLASARKPMIIIIQVALVDDTL